MHLNPTLTMLFRGLSLVAWLFMAGAAGGQEVNIPDPELQAAIRAHLHKPIGDITVADMQSLTRFYVEGLG